MSDQSEIPQWHLPERYKLISKIGAGAFGSVYLARDTATRELVAIKCVRGIFDDIFDAKRLLREISILHTLRHPNVVKIKRLIIPPEEDTFNKVYIVMENCQSDLKKLSMSQVYFDTEQIKFLLYQMICGLRYIHSANILHRDLKPANLLLNSDGSLKICDFGLSRSYSRLNREYIDAKHMSKNMEYEETDSAEVAGVQIRTLQYNRLNRMNQKMTRVLTEHVVTRWYRAPEVILLEREYNTAVDVWSIGCIFAELLGMNQQNVPHFSERAPLFPGTSCFPLSPDLNCQRLQGGYVSAEGDQINLIFNVLGTPAEDDLEFITDEKALLYVQSFSQKQPKDITLNFPGSTPEEMEILSRMLVFNPFKRATLDEIIAMPYFDSVRQAEREVLATAPANFIWDNEVSMTKDELREVFRQELTRLYANY